MDVQRVSGALVEPMASLLVERHRDHSPLGATPVLSDYTTATAAVRAALEGGSGYAMTDGSRLVGFIVVPFPETPTSTETRLGIAHHARMAQVARSAYRILYQAVSADLVEVGNTYHSLRVLVDHAADVQTFFELEFGLDQIDGIVPVADAVGEAHPPADVRAATPADVDEIVGLAIELQRFHSRPPIFQTAVNFDVASVRRGVEHALDDDRSTVIVIEDDVGVQGMAQAGPASAYLDTVDIGMNVVAAGARSRGLGTAMLRFLLGWAASRRYRYCTVGWTSSNLLSDAFYRSRGFTPVRFRLHRRIDPRISPSTDTIDDRSFGHGPVRSD